MNYYENPKLLFQGKLRGDSYYLSAGTPQYTSPILQAGGSVLRPPSTLLTEILIANFDDLTGAAPTTKLVGHMAPSTVDLSGLGDEANVIFPGVEIEAFSFTRITLATVMPAGYNLWFYTIDNDSVICLTISGVERTPVLP